MNTPQLITGRFELHEFLAKGGMGTVYRGYDCQTDQLVAIKRLKPEVIADDPTMLARFQREGEALYQLNHPNIVKMIAAVEDADQHYLIMEYVPGGSLRDYLMRESQIAIDQLLRIAIELADALTRAHYLNIIHRDIKPDNVLLALDGTPRLTDFGVAHIGRSDLTRSGDLVGTVSYWSPECFEGLPQDARSDIWALGLTLFELLTGEHPFRKGSMMETMQAIVTEPVPMLESICPDAPIALVDLIYRMMEKNYDQRLRSVRWVGLELEAIIRSLDSSQGSAIYTSLSRSVNFNTPAQVPGSKKAKRLPLQTTLFIGREDELETLANLLAKPSVRLITILAPGGMGKTRLALEVAERHLDHVEDGVYFVALAPLSASSKLVAVIAETVECPFQNDGREFKQQLLDYLETKNILLVLDNFEHLLDGTALVSEIINAAPHVKIVATSRERLNLNTETIFTLEGLDFAGVEKPEDALRFSATKLFIESATRAQPDFTLTSRDVSYVTQICREVQGMPLGIVLAAAWITSLSLKEIAQEIHRNLDFLETDQSDIPARQRSIRAVFEYSWCRLSDAERDVLMRLAIFKGGFTRQAAEQVTGASLRTLTGLVNKSLLKRNPNSGRYEIHELLRQYLVGQLTDAGLSDATYEAHSAYYLKWLAGFEDDLVGVREMEAIREIEPETENIDIAWRWAAQTRNFETIGLARIALLRSDARDVDTNPERLKALLAFAREKLAPQPGEEPHPVWGKLLLTYNHPLSIETIETATAIAKAHHDVGEIANCTANLGYYKMHHDDEASGMALFEDALAQSRQLGKAEAVATLLCGIGYMSEDEHKSWNAYVEALAIARQIGHQRLIALCLVNLAYRAFQRFNDYDMAKSYHEEVLVIFRNQENWAHYAAQSAEYAFDTLLAEPMPSMDQVSDRINEAAGIAQRLNSPAAKLYILLAMSLFESLHENYAEADDYAKQSLDYYTSHDISIPKSHSALVMAIASCGLNDFDGAKKQFGKMLESSGVFTASTLPLAALVAQAEGQNERAAQLLALAFTRPMCPKGWLTTWPLISRLQAALLAALGDGEYAAAWEAGKALDFDTVITDLKSQAGAGVESETEASV